MLTRRNLLRSAPALLAPALAHAARSRLKIGVTDWNLRLSAKLEAVALAATLGFEGVEVSLGRKPVGGKLLLDNAELQAAYLAAAARHKVALAGTCLDIFHDDHLKNNPQAEQWLAAAIPITAKLNARVLLMPFFGKAALDTRAEQDYVADLLKQHTKAAEKAGVVLGLEDSISAEANVRIMERSASPAVKVYYDVGNSTNFGFDIYREIPWLGASRICQFHLKDQGYLGQGKVDLKRAMDRIMELGFNGFANLETDAPSGSIDADMKRNLGYVHGLLG